MDTVFHNTWRLYRFRSVVIYYFYKFFITRIYENFFFITNTFGSTYFIRRNKDKEEIKMKGNLSFGMILAIFIIILLVYLALAGLGILPSQIFGR